MFFLKIIFPPPSPQFSKLHFFPQVTSDITCGFIINKCEVNVEFAWLNNEIEGRGAGMAPSKLLDIDWSYWPWQYYLYNRTVPSPDIYLSYGFLSLPFQSKKINEVGSFLPDPRLFCCISCRASAASQDPWGASGSLESAKKGKVIWGDTIINVQFLILKMFSITVTLV